MPARYAYLIVLLGLTWNALAQQPATQPAPASSTVTTPDGMVRLEVAGRSLICLPADKDWVAQAAGRVPSVAGPTTKPADLLTRLTEKRDVVSSAMMKDLPHLKPSQIEKIVDEQIVPNLKTLSTARPRIVYLVAPAEHIREAMRQGWTDRRFRYNRVSDTFDFDRTVAVNAEGNEESAVAAMFAPNDAVADRTAALAQYILGTEEQVMQQVANRATTVVLLTLAEFIAREALKDLPRQEDQVWLVNGLSNVLAARYVSIFHGSPLRQFVDALIVGPIDSPVNAAGIDLLHPLPVASLKPEFVAPQLDARRRKAIAVMFVWFDQAGDEKMMPMVNAVVRAKPADGATLVKVVKDTSGVDLTELLMPR